MLNAEVCTGNTGFCPLTGMGSNTFKTNNKKCTSNTFAVNLFLLKYLA